MAADADQADDSVSHEEFEAYANYKRQSERVAQCVEDAVKSYARIRSAHREGASVPPKVAAEARADIESAALRLRSEMESERDGNDLYDRLLSDWEGDEGYIQRFDEVELRQSVPGWMYEFLSQIRRAAFERGYLYAGRAQEKDEQQLNEKQTEAMFQEF
jgi:hypothetical protein